MSIEEHLALVVRRLRAYEDGDSQPVLDPMALDEANDLLQLAFTAQGVRVDAVRAVGWLRWRRYQALPEGLDDGELEAAVALFKVVGAVDPGGVPGRLLPLILPGGQPEIDPDERLLREAMESLRRGLSGDDAAALARAIELFSDIAVRLPDHPARAGILSNLGIALQTRYERDGALSDLDAALAAVREAVDSAPVEDPAMLSNLGNILRIRATRTHEVRDLDDAIVAGRRSVDVAPIGSEDVSKYVFNLSLTWFVRFDLTSDGDDLDTAIATGRAALAGTSVDHPRRGARLVKLQEMLRRRFEHAHQLEDLDMAAAAAEEAAGAMATDDPDRAMMLADLAELLRVRLTFDQADVDRDATVAAIQAAVSAAPAGRDQGQLLSRLGDTLRARFGRTREPADLDAAVAVGRQAADAGTASGPDRARPLLTLAESLHARFRHAGDTDDLDAAVQAGRQAFDLCPPGDAMRALIVVHLAVMLEARYLVREGPADLDEAIAAAQLAVATTAESVPRTELRFRLGVMQYQRFLLQGDPADLDAAVGAIRTATAATQIDDVELLGRLTGLASALHARFQHFGALSDLDAALKALRQAVEVSPSDHPDRGLLDHTISICLRSRFLRLGYPPDLDLAIDAGTRAVDAGASSPDNAAVRLSNLGLALRTRFERAGDAADLEAAITMARRAADASPAHGPQRAVYLSQLGNALMMRCERMDDPDAGDAGIVALRESLRCTPDHDPKRPAFINNLGVALQVRGRRTGEASDLAEALQGWSLVARLEDAAPMDRLRAARAWTIATAGADGPQAALEMFQTAMTQLPLLTGRQAPRLDQHQVLQADALSLARDAAAGAIAAGRPELAVSWLEQGRGVYWSQLLDARTDLTALRRAAPDLADQFEDVLGQLEVATESNPGHEAQSAVGEDRRRAGARLSALIDQIRALPPNDLFPEPDLFLRPPPMHKLLPQADDDVVAMVNLSRWRCDALILRADGVTVLPLQISEPEVIAEAVRFVGALHDFDASAQTAVDRVALEMAITATLEWLWDNIAAPILDGAGITGEPEGRSPRLWWCPTGQLTVLPLHAAGYHHTRQTVYDRVVSSYTPTLRALSHARSLRPSTNPHQILILALPDTPDASPLPGAADEHRFLTTLFPPERRTVLTGMAASRDSIIDAISRHRVAHLACHAIQFPLHPMGGGLRPYDWDTAGLVTVADLATTRRGGDLAFLSACQTAAGGVTNLDEAGSIAAAMQHAGWRHVIGTLWSVWDEPAGLVTRAVYPKLINADGDLDPAGAPDALHQVIRDLRTATPDTPSVWAPFIHIGP
ncbi:CHAT domain-containing protein [Dactylosporangium siamense]|uniref:CHAT domain-containing protein n=1 Tax=Dactylosporangium siamense TaxID=685454 RepID=A0A919PV47_9ACTN|nr:CHAT domain-containing protein [Dactylosporangium siamense]GIG50767.1 CHAT domain-containing protein [Dactylosporangium siamense]